MPIPQSPTAAQVLDIVKKAPHPYSTDQIVRLSGRPEKEVKTAIRYLVIKYLSFVSSNIPGTRDREYHWDPTL